MLSRAIQPLVVFLEHLHAPRVRLEALRFRSTWLAGAISLIAFFILTITGVILMYAYVPTEDGAWESIRALQETTRTGSMLRSLHAWAAQLMVVSVILHLVNLTVRGACQRPKVTNWWVGVILLLLTLVLSYTGYLLPYDQLAYWAITVGSHMVASAPGVGSRLRELFLGGSTIGTPTLLRFYVHHCITLPLVFGGLLAVHMYRIRKDGGLSLPLAERENPPLVTSRSRILSWETGIFLLVTLALVVFCLEVDVPLGPKADPATTPNPMKAPWYLVGLQELLHFHPAFFVSYLVPCGAFAALFAMPWLPDAWRQCTLATMSRPSAWILGSSLVGLGLAWGLSGLHLDATLLATSLGFAALLVRARGPGPLGGRLGRVSLVVFLLLYVLVSYAGLISVALYLRGPDWELLP